MDWEGIFEDGLLRSLSQITMEIVLQEEMLNGIRGYFLIEWGEKKYNGKNGDYSVDFQEKIA